MFYPHRNRSHLGGEEYALNQHEETNLYEFEISGRYGIYYIDWPNLRIRGKVERIREHTDHEVKGEVMITSERPESAGHLRQGRLNLTSPASRRTLAASLARREAFVDWDMVLEQLCVSVLREFRAGIPESLLDGNAGVEEGPRYLIDPMLVQDEVNIIYGKGSSGKSYFAQYLSVLVDAGLSAGGLCVEPSKVLYLDWETTRREINSRVSYLRRGLGIEGVCGIWYKRMTAALHTDLETVKDLVVQKGISLVVVDSLASALGGEPESAAVCLNMFNALRELEVTSLCIHHVNKQTTAPKEAQLFGSNYIYNSARNLFQLHADIVPQSRAMTIGVYHVKMNNGPMIADMGYELAFGEGTVTLERRDVKDNPELEQHQRNVDRLDNALRDGPLTVGDLVDKLGKSESQIRNLLSQYNQKFFKLPTKVNGLDRYARAMQIDIDEWVNP
mgnify:CR=1 FL=1